MLRRAFVVIVLMSAPILRLEAQTPKIQNGDLVRPDSIKQIEVSGSGTTRIGNILRNAAVGLLVGATGGAIAGPLVLSKDCYSSTLDVRDFGGCLQDLSDGKARLRTAAYFGAAGALIGGLFGAFLGTDSRSEEIRVEKMHLSVTPELNGILAVRMSIGF